MKIAYCIDSTFRSGGMERVLTNKANYLADIVKHQIIIITTDQKNRPHFFKLSPSIQCIDLEINYQEDSKKGLLKKTYQLFKKKRIHQKKLSQLLLNIKADFVISMFGNDATFICGIQDGSKKILEFHFSKHALLLRARKGVGKWIDILKSKHEERIVKKFDRFIVLTKEDKSYWGNLSNIDVIPNAAIPLTNERAILNSKVIIAVGRLSHQKGYERLIRAWKIVHNEAPDWQLKIYGSGELYEYLQQKINSNNLTNTIEICTPTSQIGRIYLNSSALVLSSRYEGLPMVLLEAMSCGIPVVAYACKCGPKDVITHGHDGLLVEEGNIVELAVNLLKVINNKGFRQLLGANAKDKANQYSEQIVMNKWLNLFDNFNHK